MSGGFTEAVGFPVGAGGGGGLGGGAFTGNLDIGANDVDLIIDADGDTFIHSNGGDDQIHFNLASSGRFYMDAVTFRGALAGGGAILNDTSTATVPTLLPYRTDTTSGVGGVTGTVSLITGSVEALTIDASQDTTLASAIINLADSSYFRWGAGDVFLTHSANKLEVTGGVFSVAGNALYTAAGNGAGPSVASGTDTDTGFYWSNSNELAISCGGTQRFNVNTTTSTFTVPVLQPGIYGEISVANASGTTNITTGGTFQIMDQWTTDGAANDAVADQANNKITLTTAGKYLVNFNVAFYCDQASDPIGFKAYLDTSPLEDVQFDRKVPINDLGAGGFSGIVTATAGQDLSVYFTAAGTNDDIRIKHANLSAVFIGT